MITRSKKKKIAASSKMQILKPISDIMKNMKILFGHL